MSLGARIRGLRTDRGIRQKTLAEKAGLTPSLVSQIESDKLTPSLHTLGRLAGALEVPIGAFFEQAPNGQLHLGRRKDYAVVSFDGSSERWEVLAAGLFRGKVRAVVSTLGRRGSSVPPERVLIEPGQMKLMYVLDGKVALQYNGRAPPPRGRRLGVPRRRRAAHLGERRLRHRADALGHHGQGRVRPEAAPAAGGPTPSGPHRAARRPTPRPREVA